MEERNYAAHDAAALQDTTVGRAQHIADRTPSDVRLGSCTLDQMAQLLAYGWFVVVHARCLQFPIMGCRTEGAANLPCCIKRGIVDGGSRDGRNGVAGQFAMVAEVQHPGHSRSTTTLPPT